MAARRGRPTSRAGWELPTRRRSKRSGGLKREGLAVAKPYRGVFLTEAGESLAARVRTRHRVVVDLLLAVGVPLEAAESDAEGIEHHVSDATMVAFARFLRRDD